jgi:phage portal protein BeeE
MSVWSWLTAPVQAGDIPNANPASTVGAGQGGGNPHGVEVDDPDVIPRSFPAWHPSAWAGWPSEWSTPNWDFGSRFNELVDVAWACLDKNASVLSTMPVYRTSAGQIVEPASWMLNPDPRIYSSWSEFAKQLFWDWQCTGEAFVMLVESFSNDFPKNFRVVPPWAFHVEIENGQRRYRLGDLTGPDVTDLVLHIRYKSTTDGARGVGPLSVAGGRMLTAGIIAKYVREMTSSGGIVVQTIEAEASLTKDEAQELMTQYMTSRIQNSSAPPVFDNGAKLVDHPAVSPKEMAMAEIEQFNESRIAILLGIPPFLVGLPSGGDSLTYSNVSSLFDFHDRSYLRPAAIQVMTALSWWALPRGQAAELNRDEYSRPSFDARAPAWKDFVEMGAVKPEAVARYERFQGGTTDTQIDDEAAMTAVTGGEQ